MRVFTASNLQAKKFSKIGLYDIIYFYLGFFESSISLGLTSKLLLLFVPTNLGNYSSYFSAIAHLPTISKLLCCKYPIIKGSPGFNARFSHPITSKISTL